MLSQLEGNEKEKVTRIMVASIVTGIAVAIAPSLIVWLSGVDINNIQTTSNTIAGSSGGLPPALANVLRNGFTVITVLGAVIAAGGLILGAIKMQLQ
ncbi:hypothetical protein NTE_03378 [Candidatus Nitrososphaera evergladensis SR1]|jgi:hypothetical protein|uniref:Uncharacterized protein n=1 Tax=Candidatus Nitrososphaera evergladensis SR1 TaxID=1459636 RepID=A0A075MUR3_9ARCH|nr:hypothetical protein [Candidatus Nitrososphaera evergladensis]AIF85406.1 hypothetical protein NTE_03378 [Candidatus Nitrososphaera evergladensis SR1]HVX02268.1 hypothetical protein [Nitrososphaera sp.]